MWQSRVEIEGYFGMYFVRIAGLKRCIAEFPLRMGLIRAS